MEFASPLTDGILIKRYKRFLADVQLPSGDIITAHTSNTGSMMGCHEPGSRVWLSKSDNPKRKYPYSWEIIEIKKDSGCTPVGINTMRSNHLVKEAIENGTIAELQGYEKISTEVKYGVENSRIDLLLASDDSQTASTTKCYVEVKNVTLVEENIAYFPDAVSARGTKHLRELAEVVRNGNRGVIFYCIQRSDAEEFRPADSIDSKYGSTLREAVLAGVEAIAYFADVNSRSIKLIRSLPVVLPQKT